MSIMCAHESFLIREILRSGITGSLHPQIFKGFSYSLPACPSQMSYQCKLPPVVYSSAGFPTPGMSIIEQCILSYAFVFVSLIGILVSLCHFHFLLMVVKLKLFSHVQWSLVFLVKIACSLAIIGVFDFLLCVFFLLIYNYFIILMIVSLCLTYMLHVFSPLY